MLMAAFARTGQQMTEALEQDLLASIEILEFEKEETVLRQNDVCEYVYFITEGSLMVTEKINQKDYPHWFLLKKDFCISPKSFFEQQPSKFAIVALENTRCISLTQKLLQEMCLSHQELNNIQKAVIIHYYIESDENKTHLHLTAAERIAFLYEKKPHFFDHINDYHLAAYLGMAGPTFSTLKKEVLPKNRSSDILSF